MVYLDERGKEKVLKDFFLKKFIYKLEKLLIKTNPSIKLAIDFESKPNIPILIFAFPDETPVENPKQFFEDLGDLFQEIGNLKMISQAFLMTVEKLSIIEEKLERITNA